jgi:DNA-binding MarR family transcriptional regulator
LSVALFPGEMKMAKSVFNHKDQTIESKIVVALERVSEAFRVLLWQESKENSLSPIQIQLLIFILFHSQDLCKVSYLAEEFNMTKATISDSIKVLLQKNLVEKVTDEIDTRSFSLVLTSEGKRIAKKSASFAATVENPIHQFSDEQKETLLISLLRIIERLNQSGVITIQRMCSTCRFYDSANNKHYCGLLKKPLKNHELMIDCPEHEIKS